MVITVTDGEPQGESRDTLFNVIRDLRRTLTSMGFSGNEVAFQFAQVGDDAKATDFLDSLVRGSFLSVFDVCGPTFTMGPKQGIASSLGGGSRQPPACFQPAAFFFSPDPSSNSFICLSERRAPGW